jgi:hypothetical protein
MRLGPLRETCVQPAPKSRWVSSGLPAYQDQSKSRADQEQIKGFPAEAGPTDWMQIHRQIVPTLGVVMPPPTLRVSQTTRIQA